MVTQRIFHTRLLTYFLFTYLRTSYLFTYLLTIYLFIYLLYLFTYLCTFNDHTPFPAWREFCTSDNGKTMWSVYDGIVMHYALPTSFKHDPIMTG